MVAVSPMLADIELDRRPVRPISRTSKTLGRWLEQFVGRLPGDYTVAKLQAFDCFRHQTTLWQMTGILLSPPLACLVVNVALESIPLADLSTGFYGSLHFQIRNFVGGTIVMMTLATTKVSCITQLSTCSWKYICGISLALATVAIATNAAIALIFGIFPVPFTQFAPAAPMGLIGALINRRFLETSNNRARLQRLDQWLAMDLAPILVYPIFTAVFMVVKPHHQLWLSLLLPILKLLLRYLLWIVVEDELDLVGAATCSVGHLYHILFAVMCLQNAKSLETYGAVVGVNIVQMLLNCRGILQDSHELRKSAEQLTTNPAGDVISTALAIAQLEPVSRLLHRKSPSRLLSTFPGYQRDSYLAKYYELLQAEQQDLSRNSRLTNIKVRDPREGSRRRSLPNSRTSSHDLRTPVIENWTCILPRTDNLKRSGRSPSSIANVHVDQQYMTLHAKRGDTTRTRSRQAYETHGGETRQREAYVRHFTSALHQTEIVLFQSYITIVMTAFYGIYQALLFWLPNRKYFATMVTTTTFDDVANMMLHLVVLCSLELLFMIMYTILISRELGFSGIHQLTFVLWTQRILIYGKFVMLPSMILGFPLAHFGNGVIFQLKTRE